nr:MAG TPA: hypothetical protein [Caudoviricetes sp.]
MFYYLSHLIFTCFYSLAISLKSLLIEIASSFYFAKIKVVVNMR